MFYLAHCRLEEPVKEDLFFQKYDRFGNSQAFEAPMENLEIVGVTLKGQSLGMHTKVPSSTVDTKNKNRLHVKVWKIPKTKDLQVSFSRSGSDFGSLVSMPFAAKYFSLCVKEISVPDVGLALFVLSFADSKSISNRFILMPELWWSVRSSSDRCALMK